VEAPRSLPSGQDEEQDIAAIVNRTILVQQRPLLTARGSAKHSLSKPQHIPCRVLEASRPVMMSRMSKQTSKIDFLRGGKQSWSSIYLDKAELLDSSCVQEK
jgi:hypothetical protein